MWFTNEIVVLDAAPDELDVGGLGRLRQPAAGTALSAAAGHESGTDGAGELSGHRQGPPAHDDRPQQPPPQPAGRLQPLAEQGRQGTLNGSTKIDQRNVPLIFRKSTL